MKKIKKNKAMAYHVLPPYGLLNDPNGLVHFKGVTHVFFQWNSKAMNHNYKSWGHAITKDLVHYDYLKPALVPSEYYDKNGCYSGSAIVHDDELNLFYTGNVKDDEGNRTSYQCLAISKDGINFEKKGPLIKDIPGYTAHVRDPKVFKKDNNFYMVLGAQREDLSGDTILFKSRNLYNWEFLGSLLDEHIEIGYMWECPDLIEFENKNALIFSPQGLEPKGERFKNKHATGYITGEFENEIFKKDSQTFKELDLGFEFYAPQSFIYKDGRVLLFGWMGVMEESKEKSLPTIKDNWVHHLTIPREIYLNEGDKLIQKPIKELESYRKPLINTVDKQFDSDFKEPLEVRVSFDKSPDKFCLAFGENTLLRYDGQDRSFKVEREDWNTKEKEYRIGILSRKLKNIQIYLDYTSMEIFINDGEEVFSLRYFEGEGKKNMLLESNEDMRIKIDRLDL